MKTKFIRIAVLAFVAAGVPAYGQNPIVVEGLPTAIVSYADLDLSDPGGQARLNARVRRAAQQLCANDGVRDIGSQFQQRACLNFALTHARGQVEQAIAQYGSQPQFAGRNTITVAGR